MPDVPVSWSVPASTWTAPALVRLPDRIVVPVELGDHAGGRVGDRDADRGVAGDRERGGVDDGPVAAAGADRADAVEGGGALDRQGPAQGQRPVGTEIEAIAPDEMVVVAALPPDMTMELPLIPSERSRVRSPGPVIVPPFWETKLTVRSPLRVEGAGRDEEPVEPDVMPSANIASDPVNRMSPSPLTTAVGPVRERAPASVTWR